MNHARRRACAARKIGNQSESVVSAALDFLKRLGLIASFRREDRPGVDFFVTFKDSRTVPLQVKSSDAKAAQHYALYPEIAVVTVRHNCANLPPREFDRLARRAQNDIARIFCLTR